MITATDTHGRRRRRRRRLRGVRKLRSVYDVHTSYNIIYERIINLKYII